MAVHLPLFVHLLQEVFSLEVIQAFVDDFKRDRFGLLFLVRPVGMLSWS